VKSQVWGKEFTNDGHLMLVDGVINGKFVFVDPFWGFDRTGEQGGIHGTPRLPGQIEEYYIVTFD